MSYFVAPKTILCSRLVAHEVIKNHLARDISLLSNKLIFLLHLRSLTQFSIFDPYAVYVISRLISISLSTFFLEAPSD